MARPKKQTSFTPGQALYIVERAIADRKLSASDISGYMRSMADEIRSIEQRIASLAGSAADAVVAAATPVVNEVRRSLNRTVRDVKKIRKNRALSAERMASMRIQGEYLGYLRQIPKSAKAKFQKICKTDGREKAVAEMKKVLA